MIHRNLIAREGGLIAVLVFALAARHERREGLISATVKSTVKMNVSIASSIARRLLDHAQQQ